jgi:SAM-dependent methyltransferase
MTNPAPPPRVPYDDWADYYDVTDADRAPFIAFYRRLVTPSTRSLLELGCGTGTLTIAVANVLEEASPSPRLVVGVDESGGMLSIAHRRRPDLHWLRADIRAVPLRHRFDLVISCFNTLQHMLSEQDLVRAFQAVRRLLGRDGRFAFDIYQPNLAYVRTPATNRMARALVNSDGEPLEIREDTRFEEDTQILRIWWRLVRASSPDAAPLATASFSLRQYFPEQVERLLTAAGLRLQERYGEFDGSPFTRTSRKQIIVCGAGAGDAS